MTTLSTGAKRSARIVLQYLEAQKPDFEIDWNTVSLCLVQIAFANTVLILDMNQIRGKQAIRNIRTTRTDLNTAYPSQLRRIVTSSSIIKAGVGISNDANIFWEDLRTNMKNLADAGLMTRIAHIELHQDELFGPLALDTAAAEVLNVTIDKTYQKSDWTKPPHEGQKICKCHHIVYPAED
jgi:ribonuclease D